MSELRIATRASRLALIQAEKVAGMLRRVHPDVDVSLVEVTTTGDIDRTTSVTTLTEVGAFVRAIQTAVLDGTADVAVHSCKDLPVAGPSELVAFYPEREQPWDALCGQGLESLPSGARVGTGSPRRAAQLLQLRPDVEVADIRGNVETRLGKLSDGEYDAVILAYAGLHRLGLLSEIDHIFSVDEMVPAPAQAALAVEVIAGSPAAELMSTIDDPTTRASVEAERALLEVTGAGCRSALGAFAASTQDGIAMTGFVQDEAGARFGQGMASGPLEAAYALREVLEL